MSPWTRMGRFALVGGAATAVHLAVGGSAIAAGVPPLVANTVAFGAAFAASFAGHYGFTFAGNGAAFGGSLARFLAVALLGFAVNQGLLSALLASTSIVPLGAFFLATAVTALLTFALARGWAFRGPPETGRDR